MSDALTLAGMAALVAGAFELAGLGVGLIVLGVVLIVLGVAFADVQLPAVRKVLKWRRS